MRASEEGARTSSENAPQPERAEAKSVVRQLDILLLGAAGKSVSADAATAVTTTGNKLVDIGVLNKQEVDKLENLVRDATEKLKALDKFSGRELAKALMEDKKSGEVIWSKGFFFMNSTAKAFGCEDLVVKYSVGSHDGQFGIFMEKAKGYTPDEIGDAKDSGGNGIAPADLHRIKGDKMRANIQGQIAQKLNRLMWLDLITGQGDRHWNNYFVCVEKNDANNTYDVTVKGIDNDASFSSRQIGLQKYALDKKLADRFDEELKKACEAIHGEKGGEHEYNNRVAKDVGITKNDEDGSMTIDLAKATSPEVKMALIQALGMQSTALPEEIDKDFYDKLMEMDANPDKKREYLESLKPRISAAALKATENRLNEAIEYAKKLSLDGKVYDEAQWKDRGILGMMPDIDQQVTITKSDGKKVKAKHNDNAYVRDFVIRECPSLYKRDFLHLMFAKPNQA